MSAFNVVRFRVKPGREQEFIDTHRQLRPKFKGSLGGDLIQTGERTFCFIGQWRNMASLEAARPEMIAVLDQLREMLEDLGNDLGVTDPVSGESVARYKPPKKQKKSKDKGKVKDKKKDKKKGKARKKAKSRK